MKPSRRVDTVCVEKILRYVRVIDELYTLHGITSADDLAKSFMCQLAVTQALTNIYEIKQKIQTETLARLPVFTSMNYAMRNARNIASHDYDSVDFGIIYAMTRKLLDQQTIRELEAARDDTARSDTGNP